MIDKEEENNQLSIKMDAAVVLFLNSLKESEVPLSLLPATISMICTKIENATQGKIPSGIVLQEAMINLKMYKAQKAANEGKEFDEEGMEELIKRQEGAEENLKKLDNLDEEKERIEHAKDAIKKAIQGPVNVVDEPSPIITPSTNIRTADDLPIADENTWK